MNTKISNKLYKCVTCRKLFDFEDLKKVNDNKVLFLKQRTLKK